MTTPIPTPYHFYAPNDPVPQLVRVVGNMVWLPDDSKYVEVAKLTGKLVKLVEVKEGEGDGKPE